MELPDRVQSALDRLCAGVPPDVHRKLELLVRVDIARMLGFPPDMIGFEAMPKDSEHEKTSE